jgi:hypothetical protein
MERRSAILIDGSTPSKDGHGAGGQNLGYTGGVSNSGGYVGIGLDAYGNFYCDTPCTPRKPQSVVVRGARSKGYPLLSNPPVDLTAIAALSMVSPVDRINDHARTVRITISPVTSATPEPTVTVEIDPTGTGTGFVKVIDALPLTVAENGDVPKTFKMGFGAGTGSVTNIHEVRIRSAKTLVSAVPTLEQNALGALAVLLALLTVLALRHRFKN